MERAIRDRFGSKRGLVNLMRARLGDALGAFRAQREIDFEQVRRLVFVCSGNICRSPFGAEYARSRGLESDSCGLHTRGGDPADPRAIAFAADRGIDLSAHRTKNIRDYRPEPGDLLLAMEPGQLRELQAHARERQWPDRVQLSILPLFKRLPSPYLHDPYSASPAFFEHCQWQVMESVDGILQRMGSQ
jgi:protein-tyrosine phosphatase